MKFSRAPFILESPVDKGRGYEWNLGQIRALSNKKKRIPQMSQSGRTVHGKALPNYQSAVLPREKLEKYVLDPTNPVGKHKAIVFKRVLGFVQSDWELLAKAILDELAYHEAVLGRRNQYGQRYNVTMPITGPDGRTADVLTAWIVDTGEDYPRFITAYVE